MVHTTRKKSKYSKHPTKAKRIITLLPKKSLKFTKKSKVVFQELVDIAKIHGKAFDIYLPEILYAKKNRIDIEKVTKAYTQPACKLDIKHPIYSARTSSCLNYIKRKDIKKRVFYVFSHGMMFSTISQIPTNTFLLQTGDICSVTLGNWDSDLLSIFNNRNKFHTLDIFFGKYGPTGPSGQVYELLYMYAPYELYPNKYLSYTSEDLEKKQMLFGIYEKNMDTDKHIQLKDLKDTSGAKHTIDSIFQKGVTSKELMGLLNLNYSDSINFVVEIACSVAGKVFDFVSYAFPLSLMNRPKFYSIDLSGRHYSLLSIQRPKGRTSPQNKEDYKKNIIPEISIAFVYDSYTNCMYNIRSLEQLYILYTDYSKFITSRRIYVGIHSVESTSKNSAPKNIATNMLPSFDDIDYYFRKIHKSNYIGAMNGIYIIEFFSFIVSLFLL